MTRVLDVLLVALAVALLVPMAVLAVECLAALLPRRRAVGGGERPRCAVLIPAHDEEVGLPRTLADLRPQLRPGDRLIVIADNCTDRTAAVARIAGAEALERTDRDRRGKGYALDFGVRALAADPPAVVVVIDADCRVAPGSLDVLARAVAATGRPIQAADLLDPPAGSGPRGRLSAYAFRFKNLVRPLGLDRLGLPCLLCGTGMAFPWPVIREATLATGNIVEDMHLGVELALAGHAARFEPAAEVRGELPADAKAAAAQRQRWEHGHLHTLLTQVPRLLGAAVRQRRADLLGLTAELSVPPLSALGLVWLAVTAAAILHWHLGGSGMPAALLLGGAAVVAVAGLLAWAKYGRDVLPFGSLLAAPLYVAWKVPIYLAFLVRRQTRWVRTARAMPPGKEGPP